jgi:hypothetical protein
LNTKKYKDKSDEEDYEFPKVRHSKIVVLPWYNSMIHDNKNSKNQHQIFATLSEVQEN